jgi:multiple sugar transport system permease protein
MAAWRFNGGTVSEPGEAEYVEGREVSADLFSVLGISVLRGHVQGSDITQARFRFDVGAGFDQHLRHFQVILQLPGYDEQVLRENIQMKFFPRATGNSLIIAVTTTFVVTSLGTDAAYSLSRFVRPRTRKWVMFGLLVSRMLPLISVLIPIYMVLLASGLLDTLVGLIIVYSGLLLPFAIWIFEGLFRQFPRELEEAAIIDGASPFAVFTKVVLPLSWNGLFATGVFVFISTWSDFIVGFIMTNTEKAYPVSVVIARNMSSWHEPDWGVLNAAGVFAAIIPVVLAFVLRRLVARGRLAGALKG